MPKKKTTNAAFLKMAQAPLKPSPQLAEVLGSATPISRPQVAKKVWAYIKKHNLQDPKKRREIVADEKLMGPCERLRPGPALASPLR